MQRYFFCVRFFYRSSILKSYDIPVRFPANLFVQNVVYLPLNFFEPMEVKDSNGNILNDGDSVTVIKDLKVKGSSDVIKRGTKVNNIRLTDDPAEIDCRVNKTAMVLRTEFVKKV